MEENKEQKIKSFRVSASEVLEHIFSIDYLLPQEDTLCASLRERKLAPMPLTEPAKADFTTHDKEAFLRYLRVSSIKTVMFCYQYYTEEDLDNMYNLSDAERAFFRTHMRAPAEYFNGDEEIPVITRPFEETDFVYWQDYQKYVRLALDLSYPKTLQLCTLHQGKVIACELDDLWLERLCLLNAQDIKQECVNTRNYSGYGKGGFNFTFDYDVGTDEEAEETEAAESPIENDTMESI